jgi:hypothetical protein
LNTREANPSAKAIAKVLVVTSLSRSANHMGRLFLEHLSYQSGRGVADASAAGMPARVRHEMRAPHNLCRLMVTSGTD